MDPFTDPSKVQNDVFCPLLLPCFLSLFLSPLTARGTKTEEFEYVETLLRNPQKIHLRKKIEQIEEEIDPRKEALVAYRVFVQILVLYLFNFFVECLVVLAARGMSKNCTDRGRD